MSVSQDVYSVCHKNSFVIVGWQGNFIYFFGINLMTMTSYDIHFSVLFLTAKQTLSVVMELSTPFCNILCHLYFLSSEPSIILYGYSFTLKPTNSTICFPPASSLNIPSTLLLSPVFNSRWMNSWVVTSDKPFLNVGVDIFVNIFGLNFICERVGVCEE